jgi:hypothetical protein
MFSRRTILVGGIVVLARISTGFQSDSIRFSLALKTRKTYPASRHEEANSDQSAN